MDEKTHKFYKNSTLSHSNVLAVVIKFQLMFLVVFAVLGRIRQLEKKLMITNSRLPSVREVLSRFSGRLSEAQGFLAKADSNVHEAENKNRASVLKFQRHEVISRDPTQLLQRPTSLYTMFDSLLVFTSIEWLISSFFQLRILQTVLSCDFSH